MLIRIFDHEIFPNHFPAQGYSKHPVSTCSAVKLAEKVHRQRLKPACRLSRVFQDVGEPPFFGAMRPRRLQAIVVKARREVLDGRTRLSLLPVLNLVRLDGETLTHGTVTGTRLRRKAAPARWTEALEVGELTSSRTTRLKEIWYRRDRSLRAAIPANCSLE